MLIVMGTLEELLSSKIIYKIESGYVLCKVPTREHPKKQFFEVPLWLS